MTHIYLNLGPSGGHQLGDDLYPSIWAGVLVNIDADTHFNIGVNVQSGFL